MQKIFLLIFIFVLVGLKVSSQSPAVQWQKSLGGTLADWVSSIVQISDGSYVMACTSNSNDGDVSGNHGGSDFWIVKINSLGIIQWQNSLGGTNDDVAKCIKQTADKGYIVTGTTLSNDGDVSGNNGYFDFWLVKLDSLGGIQWQKSLGSDKADYANDVLQTSDRGYIVAGYSCRYNLCQSTPGWDVYDFLIIKTDSLGNVQWQKNFGGTYNEQANSVIETLSGGYLIAGNTSSDNEDVSGNHSLSSDVWLLKLDNLGTKQWQKCFGGFYGDGAARIKQISNGDYILFATTSSNDGDVSGLHGNVKSDSDFWLLKLDSQFNMKWQKCFGGSSLEVNEYGDEISDGGFILSCATSSNDGDVSGFKGGLYDYWIVKVDSMGNLKWQKCLGGTSYDIPNCIRQTNDGGYIVAGYSYSNDGDVTGNHGGADAWIVKLDGNIGVVRHNYELNKLNLHPNPAENTLHIVWKGMNEKTPYSVTDIMGRVLLTGILQKQETSLSVGDLNAGIYVFHLVGMNLKFVISR